MAAVNRRTRGTRANPVSDENAVPSLAAARSARTATAGAKDNLTGLRPRSTSAAGKSVLSDVTKSTTTTTTKKRTALGPVTNVGETKLGGIKEDGAEGSKKAITKPGSATTRTTLLARQRAASSISSSTRPTSAEPIQPTAIRPPTRRTRANTVTAPAQKSQAAPVSDIPEEAQGDDDADAMEIDPPEMHSGIPIRPQVPGRGPSRLSTAAPSTTSVAKSTLTAATHQPLRARTTSAVTNGTARPIAGNAAVRRSKVLVAPRPVIAPQLAGDEDEQDEGAPVKKRRTSSMDADETDALQPRHPRAKALENLVVQKREVKRKTAHTASASTSRSSALVEDIISEKLEVIETVRVLPQDWEDLDEQDSGDPMMVSEYADEIFEYMRRAELTNMPNPNYMDTQKELTWKFRDVLVDWLVQVHGSFRMLPETLFLCINIVDRFLSVRVVSLVKFQLVGVSALYLAAKYEEMHYPTVSDLVKCCDAGYDDRSILQAEAYILKSINFDLSYPGPMSFLRRVSKADDYDINSRTLAKYFVEMASLDWNLIAVTPSLASAASIWLARRILRRGHWTPTLVHYAGYTEEDIIPVAHKMVCYILRERDEGIQHEHFAKKYSRKVYNKARQFIQEWAKGLTKMNVNQFDRLMTVEGY